MARGKHHEKGAAFSEEQSVGVEEAEAGVPVKDLCRRVVVSDATFHWKAKYGGVEMRRDPGRATG